MSVKTTARVKSALFAGIATLSLSACASVPGANVAPGTPITTEEAQLGAKYHPQFVAEFGGEMTGPQATYVRQIGQNIAVQSGLSGARNDFTVTLLNSSVNNAFAVPGGYVYVTRQLVTLMNNEAELAGVLGHEVGHVAARHSAKRQAAAQRNSVLGVLGAVLTGAVLGNNPLGQQLQQGFLQGSQLLTLRYSRSQELEADALGVEYLTSAGYDPRAMGTVLQSLAAQNALDASLQGRDATIPEWASTHPDPASRVQNAFSLAQRTGVTGVTNRDTFLSRIDGMIYGDDPEQGVIEGRAFIHPELRLSFVAPEGFYMINSTRAVSVNGNGGQAQLTTAAYNGNLDSYVTQVFASLGNEQQQIRPQSVQRTSVNGLTAAVGQARVNTGQNNVDVTVFAYEFSNSQAFHFIGITPAGQSGVFSSMYQSMRRISAAEAAQVIPRRIDVITARSGDTVQSLSRRMAYDRAQETRFRVLNGMGSGDRVVAGQKYKIVIKSN
ncbi:M48 family metalloprotease [Paraurantiacibacter namhicola]|uniref:TPR repeat-containing protein YfgC n=1 Tax=Paraurantiacibacter namhicola TaxID=645517 RepID=A0A1C7D9Q1_9SPHN|nr:M48 family metalloprotease [Paraurantiacibacter namhicola]ANU08194.1 TPR repeat-containing protein YfgC precursor [Paraurantiacibacter namhicola]